MREFDRIELRKLSFRGHHGAYSDEQDYGQRLEVDLVLFGDFRCPCQTDRLSDAVDYATVCRTVLEIAESQSCNLLERLAAIIADGILERFPVERVTVSVAKEPDGIPGMPACIRVVLTREKED